MKRLVVIPAILIVAAAAYASTAITVTPSTMKSGETKTLTDDGTTIKVTRDGDNMDIRIEGAAGAKHITVTRNGDGDIRINRGGRVFINGGDFTVPGIHIPEIHVPEVHAPRLHQRHMKTMFVCPKDGTTLSVPEGKDEQTYKCPLDGTTMEKKKGKGFAFYFDDSDFEAFESL